MIYKKNPVATFLGLNLWGEPYKRVTSSSSLDVKIDFNECIRKLNETHSSKEVQKTHVDWKEYLSNREEELGNIERVYRKSMAAHGVLVATEYSGLMKNGRLWMPGIALITAYLKAKKGMSGLFVCATKESLSRKIKEIVQSNKDERCALVVGVNEFNNSEERNFPLHKVCVCIEKMGDDIKVVFLDSFGSLNLSRSIFSEVQDSVASGKNRAFFYLSEVQREFAGYGCAIFALQDAISFLQHENFFEKIEARASGDRNIITRLPPGFMIGTQSYSSLNRYKKEFDQLEEMIPGRKKSLAEYLSKNSVLDSCGKLQNQYITKKMLKYMNFIACAVRDLKTAELKELISSSLLT